MSFSHLFSNKKEKIWHDKKCLELHGGNISVDSQVGIGTTFTLDLPWVEKANP